MNISDVFSVIYSERKLKTVNFLVISTGSERLYRIFATTTVKRILAGKSAFVKNLPTSTIVQKVRRDCTVDNEILAIGIFYPPNFIANKRNECKIPLENTGGRFA